MTKGRESGARPSGAWLPLFDSSSLSSLVVKMPHAAKSLGSAAPVDVETITSASRNAFAAATLQAYYRHERKKVTEKVRDMFMCAGMHDL
jgi:hypothetical protein